MVNSKKLIKYIESLDFKGSRDSTTKNFLQKIGDFLLNIESKNTL